MKRLDYETLAMEEVAVEMECGFLSASVVNNDDKSTVSITGHEVNEIGDDIVNEWNSGEWQ